jgi:hypothetical protein
MDVIRHHNVLLGYILNSSRGTMPHHRANPLVPHLLTVRVTFIYFNFVSSVFVLSWFGMAWHGVPAAWILKPLPRSPQRDPNSCNLQQKLLQGLSVHSVALLRAAKLLSMINESCVIVCVLLGLSRTVLQFSRIVPEGARVWPLRLYVVPLYYISTSF